MDEESGASNVSECDKEERGGAGLEKECARIGKAEVGQRRHEEASVVKNARFH